MKNYKSWLSYVAFFSAYGYSIYSGKEEPIIYTTGLFFLVITIALMLRSEQLLELLKTIIERFKR